MACMLWLTGHHFDPGPVAAALSLTPYDTWRQGDYLGRRQVPTSGLSFVASEAGLDAFRQQVTDTVAFIQAYRADLLRLGALAVTLEAGRFYFDFGLYSRLGTVAAQTDELPAELVKLCGEVGAGIRLSQYPLTPDDYPNT